MCRAGGRRCETHWSEEKRQRDLARRRRIYHARKNATTDHENSSSSENPSTSTSTAPATPTSVLSATQAAYFQDTQARNPDGTLLTLYHGAAVDFDSFDPERLGRGNDSWGNGFYFTNSKETAEGYGGDVKEFYLNLKNPIRIDGREHMSLDQAYEFDSNTVANILKSHPDMYAQPDSEDAMNPLGDYAPDFWDREHHTPEQFDAMINQVARDYFNPGTWATVEGVFRDHGAAFLNAVQRETGHDGVIVTFDDSAHYVAWNSSQMKLTSNTEPTDSTRVSE